jgi:hypothetical protein
VADFWLDCPENLAETWRHAREMETSSLPTLPRPGVMLSFSTYLVIYICDLLLTYLAGTWYHALEMDTHRRTQNHHPPRVVCPQGG